MLFYVQTLQNMQGLYVKKVIYGEKFTIEVRNNLWYHCPMIIEIFPSGPLETNAFIIGCNASKKAIIVDPAYQSKEKILERGKALGLSFEKIYLTHSHWDHFADLADLKKEIDKPIYVHKLDSENVKTPGSDGLPLFIPIKGVKPDHFLEEGQVHTVGELSFTVLHTPGHSPGGVCFFFEKEKVLIAGDTLFKGSYGNLSFPGCNEEDMLSSLQKLAELPKETKVYPGHGPSTSIGDETWLKNPREFLGY